MGRRRFGRPNRFDLLAMMLVNAAASGVIFYVVYTLFNIQPILTEALAARGIAMGGRIALIVPLIPGAGIAFSCLWYWLILTGRRNGLSWGGALLYGVLIACADVPVGGFVQGALEGNPLMGLLIGLVLLLVLPPLLLATILAGLLLGGSNGWLANKWIERYRRR